MSNTILCTVCPNNHVRDVTKCNTCYHNRDRLRYFWWCIIARWYSLKWYSIHVIINQMCIRPGPHLAPPRHHHQTLLFWFDLQKNLFRFVPTGFETMLRWIRADRRRDASCPLFAHCSIWTYVCRHDAPTMFATQCAIQCTQLRIQCAIQCIKQRTIQCAIQCIKQRTIQCIPSYAPSNVPSCAPNAPSNVSSNAPSNTPSNVSSYAASNVYPATHHPMYQAMHHQMRYPMYTKLCTTQYAIQCAIQCTIQCAIQCIPSYAPSDVPSYASNALSMYTKLCTIQCAI